MKLNVKLNATSETESDYDTAIDITHYHTYQGVYSIVTPQGFEFFIEHNENTKTSSYIDIEDKNQIIPNNNYHSPTSEYFRAYIDIKEPLIILSHSEMKEYFNNYFDKNSEEKDQHESHYLFSQYAAQLEFGRSIEPLDLDFSNTEIKQLISSIDKELGRRHKGSCDVELPPAIEEKIIQMEKERLEENIKNSEASLNNQVEHAKESIRHFIDKSANKALEEMKIFRPKP